MVPNNVTSRIDGFGLPEGARGPDEHLEFGALNIHFDEVRPVEVFLRTDVIDRHDGHLPSARRRPRPFHLFEQAGSDFIAMDVENCHSGGVRGRG